MDGLGAFPAVARLYRSVDWWLEPGLWAMGVAAVAWFAWRVRKAAGREKQIQ